MHRQACSVPGRFRGLRRLIDHGGTAQERWENGAGPSAFQRAFPTSFPISGVAESAFMACIQTIELQCLAKASCGAMVEAESEKVGNAKSAFSWNLLGGAPTQGQTAARE